MHAPVSVGPLGALPAKPDAHRLPALLLPAVLGPPLADANGADELVLPLRPLVWPPLPGNRTHAASKLAILAHFSHDPSWARAMPFPVKVYSSQVGRRPRPGPCTAACTAGCPRALVQLTAALAPAPVACWCKMVRPRPFTLLQPGYQAEGLEVVPVEGRGNEARAYLTAILDHWDDM